MLAIEKHPGRARRLRRRFADADVGVLETDLRDFRWPGHAFRVVANPPFARTATLLASLAAARGLQRADLVLQRAAATAAADRLGTRARVSMSVPRSAITPQPRVDAALLTLRRR